MSSTPVKVVPEQARPGESVQHTSPLIGARFSPTGEYVIAGTQDNSLIRWNPAKKTKDALVAHKSWVRALAFVGKLLFSGDWAGRLIAWNYADAKPAPVWDRNAHLGWLRALAVSPDGKTLASCGNDKLVKLWSIPEGKPLATFSGHDWHVYNVAFHPDGKSLLSADLRGNVKEWDLAKGTVSRILDASILYRYDQGFGADIGGVRSMAFSPDGKWLACAGITEVTNAFAGVGKPLVVLFDWVAGKTKTLLRPKTNFQGTAWGVAFHPSGFILGVGGGSGGAFWAWKLEESLASFTLTLPNNARDLTVHPEGRYFTVPFENGSLRMYDMGPK
ncbi:MAG: hypothetical protein EBV06_06620 [Planctomycetia bacterium]|nr:hypothetical protein [Planctomycetia bacterium]